MAKKYVLLESSLTPYQNIARNDTRNEFVIALRYTTVHKTLDTTLISLFCGKETQYPIDLYHPKPPGDPRLEIGEVGAIGVES